MKQTEWNEALNHIDSELVEEYVARKEKLTRKNKYKSFYLVNFKH